MEFKIKNISLYPHINFAEYFNTDSALIDVVDENIEVMATSRKWRSVLDNVTRKRNIQAFQYKRYRIELIIARNLNLEALQVASSVMLTTENNGTFEVYDFELKFEKVPNSLNYKLQISFKKASEEISNYLNSDLINKLPDWENLTNFVDFRIKKPTFTQNTNVFLEYRSDINTFVSAFKFKLNELTQNIILDSWFYLHIKNENFNPQYYACYSDRIEGEYIYFFIMDAPNFILDNSEITIDFEPISEKLTNVDIDNTSEIHVRIATFLYPHIIPFNQNLEEKNINQVAKFGKSEYSRKAIVKVWLNEDELWKIDYLAIANEKDVYFKQQGKNTISPISVKDMIKVSERDDLSGLYEFDLTFNYNSVVVNNYR